MKRAAIVAALLLSAAGYVFLQTTAPARTLAGFMPGGALLYLETPNFRGLLRDWDASSVKARWLKSANYGVFSRSNLFVKLGEVYRQYGAAAGFLPDLQGVIGIAGTESALALYEIRDVEFLYISRIGQADLMKSQLWAVRDKFEQRQAGGVVFYLRSDPQSQRTVAFAFAKGYLLLATRDDLVAQSLELLAGADRPNIAAGSWYRDAIAAAGQPGELRLAMNLEDIAKSVYFRSYWIQRNASEVRKYRAGVADLRRGAREFVEERVFLRATAQPAAASGSVASLLALVPPDAGVYKGWSAIDRAEIGGLVVRKLIGPPPPVTPDWRYAPGAALVDTRAGSEGDLETRIDEQPLPPDAGIGDSIAAIRALAEQAGARSLLLVESSAATGVFVRPHAVVVIEAARDWDASAVRASLSSAAGKLWTTAGLGAGWTAQTSGRHTFERLDGLGTLVFAIGGPMLFAGNDPRLLTAVLDRTGAAAPPGEFTYAAGFRHLRERANYMRIMQALDFGTPAAMFGFAVPDRPAFFSGNVASLSEVLQNVAEVRLTEREAEAATHQTVVYRMN